MKVLQGTASIGKWKNNIYLAAPFKRLYDRFGYSSSNLSEPSCRYGQSWMNI
jgi:hypothetical protein